MKQTIVVVVLMVVCGCASQQIAHKPNAPLQTTPPDKHAASTEIVYEGGDGSSMEKAIIIKAPNNAAGVHAESDWIRKNHPRWRKIKQSLVGGDNRKMYDRIDYDTPQGETKTIYFDITDFFGK